MRLVLPLFCGLAAALCSVPLTCRLTGLGIEYRILQVYSRAPGPQKARVIFQVGSAHDAKLAGGMPVKEILRHTIGEDLKMGVILIGGASFESHKEVLSAGPDAGSQYPHLLRYDVEVAGLGSHESGHLLLLGLRDLANPGGELTNQGPAGLGLDTLRWARKQGAMTGAAHIGWGLETKTTELPNYAIPSFRGTGAHEYIVDVTHELSGPDGSLQSAVDFIGVATALPASELNIWYHTRNVGFRTRIAGERASWDLERARLGETREVPVEVVVNGQAMGRTNVLADGALREVQFEVALARSSWVALRILPSSHSNPIFLLVGGKPIRASKRSAKWCLKSVDQSWSEKEKFIQKKSSRRSWRARKRPRPMLGAWTRIGSRNLSRIEEARNRGARRSGGAGGWVL